MPIELDPPLDAELRAVLGGPPDLDLARAILIKYRERGFTSAQVSEYLQSLRHPTDEAIDDRVLDVMDLVVGWCRSDLKLW